MTDEQKDVSQMTDAELQALVIDEATSEPSVEPVAEPVPEVEPEAAPETHAASQRVPLSDLLEERGRRREAQSRMEEMERRLADMQRAWQEHAAQLQQQPEPEPPPFDADPLEHLRVQQQRLSETLQMTQRQLAEREMARRQQEQWVAMREGVNAAEQAFHAAKPDYYDAVSFLRNQRTEQYKQAGVPEQQIHALLQRDAVTLAQTAASLGRSPAQFAYETAAGMGYKGKAPAAPAEQAEKAAAAPKSLGSASGRGDASTPNLSDLQKMSDTDFDKVFNKYMSGT